MSAKVIIGGNPMYENSFSDCLFLGKYDGHDLYLLTPSNRAPDVLARSGDEPGDYVEGLQNSYGVDRALTAARRVAEFKGLLKFDPVKAMYHAHEPEDIARVKKILPTTPEYAVLAAYEAGDRAGANQLLGELLNTPAFDAKYPDSLLERLRHIDMHLYVIGKYLEGTFAPSTYGSATRDKFSELVAQLDAVA